VYISLLFFWLELGHLVVLKIFFVAAKNECLPLVQRRTHIETRTVAACDNAQSYLYHHCGTSIFPFMQQVICYVVHVFYVVLQISIIAASARRLNNNFFLPPS